MNVPNIELSNKERLVGSRAGYRLFIKRAREVDDRTDLEIEYSLSLPHHDDGGSNGKVKTRQTRPLGVAKPTPIRKNAEFQHPFTCRFHAPHETMIELSR